MFLKSQLLSSVPHGFFTRNGGVSQNIYKSLNVGIGSNDVAESITENRKRSAEALGFKLANLASLYQIHSATCILVNEPIRKKADSYVTKQTNLLLSVITADCLPVLMWEPSGIVAAAHAGWKGAVNGVLDNTISMIESIGGAAKNIRAVIGPAISASSYQVQEDFYRTVIQADVRALKFFSAHAEQGYLFDLPSYAVLRLQSLGVEKIENLNEDTLSQPNKFFSYRRSCLQNEPDYGRQLSAIGLKK